MTTPAVVVGADAHGLGVIRSLGRAGVPVIVADNDARRPAMHSRYARSFVLKEMSGPALIDGLLELRNTLTCRPVLFLTSDLQVHSVSEYRDRLADAFHIRLPERERLLELMDKSLFQQLAEKYGFAVPPAITVRKEEDFARLEKIRFPAVIKPPNKEYFRTSRAVRVDTREQAEAVCRSSLGLAPELIIQEWVTGRESDIYFCLQYRGERGLTVASFTGRKLRAWPPQTGSTASCAPAPQMGDTLHRITQAFFDKTEFSGMCSMEFRWDERRGKLFMIEPTVGRTDWQEEIASVNGINIPLAAYCHELGLPQIAMQRTNPPCAWMYPPSYWRSVLATGTFRDERPLGMSVQSACWCADDPVPYAYFWTEWMRGIWSATRWHELLSSRIKPVTPTRGKEHVSSDTKTPSDLSAIETP